MNMRCCLVVLLSLSLFGCGKGDWQPYLEGKPEVIPTVSFPTLLECQQYLHLRFGNINAPGTMYCISGCTKSESAPEVNEFRLGNLNCPFEGKQVVGQILPR